MSEIRTDTINNASGDNDSGIDLSTNDQVKIKTADTTALTVDSSQHVGIGETSPLGTLHVRSSDAGLTTVNGNSDDLVLENNGNCGISICAANTNYSQINFIDPDDTNIGQISYYHADNYMFFRVNDAERMRIDSSGHLLVGTTSSGNAGGITLIPNNSEGAGTIVFDRSNTTATSVALAFENNNSGVGFIKYNNTSTTYATTSDHRVKENVEDMTGAIDRVKQLSPKRFNFIVDDTNTLVDGFLAHEAQSVVAEAVTGTHNEVDDDGEAVMQGIDQSKLVPLLTGALKEAIAKIEALETRITALENA